MTARLPMVQPGYRFGAGATYRGVEAMVQLWAGGDDNTLFLYPHDYFSADIASLAGRLRATGYETWVTPFGYFNEWDLSVYGESLGKVWKEL